MTDLPPDLIDTLVGVTRGTAWDELRGRRQVARRHSELSYRALFHPATPGAVDPVERFAIGAYVAGLHRERKSQAHYTAALAAISPTALVDAVAHAATQTAAVGPYGAFPSGPLSVEDSGGTPFTLSHEAAAQLGPRLVAAFAHAHLLVFHPRDARPASFRPLLEAGWTTDGIVTLAQIVAFLAYQIRVVVGLRVLVQAETLAEVAS